MLAVPGKRDGVCGMASAFGENTDHINVGVTGLHHFVHIGEMGNAVFFAQGLRPFGNDVTDCNQPRTGNLSPAQKLRMLDRDAATAHQRES